MPFNADAYFLQCSNSAAHFLCVFNLPLWHYYFACQVVIFIFYCRLVLDEVSRKPTCACPFFSAKHTDGKCYQVTKIIVRPNLKAVASTFKQCTVDYFASFLSLKKKFWPLFTYDIFFFFYFFFSIIFFCFIWAWKKILTYPKWKKFLGTFINACL